MVWHTQQTAVATHSRRTTKRSILCGSTYCSGCCSSTRSDTRISHGKPGKNANEDSPSYLGSTRTRTRSAIAVPQPGNAAQHRSIVFYHGYPTLAPGCTGMEGKLVGMSKSTQNHTGALLMIYSVAHERTFAHAQADANTARHGFVQSLLRTRVPQCSENARSPSV